MKIYLGTDHVGFSVKEKIKVFLTESGYAVEDKGAFSFNKDDDYSDFIKPVAESVAKYSGNLGIVFGGSGQGEAMCANRTPGVRTAVFYGPCMPVSAVDILGNMASDSYEIVRLAREHNNANVLSLGIRFLSEEQIKEAIKIFIETSFSGDERHIRRISKF